MSDDNGIAIGIGICTAPDDEPSPYEGHDEEITLAALNLARCRDQVWPDLTPWDQLRYRAAVYGALAWLRARDASRGQTVK